MKNETRLISKINIRNDDVPPDEVHFDFVISTMDLDTHNSRMSESTLRNYATDADAGVPFMIEHSKELSRQIGNTISSAYAEDRRETRARVRLLRDADDTPADLRINEYIRRIEKGFYNRVSVGFRDAKEICDLCGKDIWDTKRIDPCTHIPGQSYDGEIATYEVRDARLREVSLVSNPSNANAKIIEREWTDDIKKIKKVSAVSDAEKQLKEYRDMLIADAIKAGIRAIDGFDKATWEERLDGQDPAFIKEQTAMWQALGDARWKSSGRKTSNEVNNNNSDAGGICLPSYLFS